MENMLENGYGDKYGSSGRLCRYQGLIRFRCIPAHLLIAACILFAVSCSRILPAADPEQFAGKTEKKNHDLNVLLFTGGHNFDPDLFYDMIFNLGNFRVDNVSGPDANSSLLSDSIEIYDVILFYDNRQEISEREKEAFLTLTERGTGLVFLHHSLVSYQEWDGFENIRGGKYYEKRYDYPPEKLSGYKHDILMQVKVEDREHPITRGVDDFEIFDEGYSNIGTIPGISILLSTDHPDCYKFIGWTNRYNNSRVVYIMPGHGNTAWSDANYRKIVANSVNWAGRKH